MSEERPRIAITVSPRRGETYYVPYLKAVEAAGAEPVALPAGTPTLPDVDGPLLPGVWDVDPALYGENNDEQVGPIDRELDETELELFRKARDQELPVLGIWRPGFSRRLGARTARWRAWSPTTALSLRCSVTRRS
ncbi:MAG: hypothetical protein E6I36_10665 [Chloroflexi bacterium]|nr:MAG: hypothetical protein E6I36_10665 [Chloroflexota bacterium]